MSASAFMRIRDGFEPHGDKPFAITPEQSQGSNFENANRPFAAGRGNGGCICLPKLAGRPSPEGRRGPRSHRLTTEFLRTSISYLREDGTLRDQHIPCSAALSPSITLNSALMSRTTGAECESCSSSRAFGSTGTKSCAPRLRLASLRRCARAPTTEQRSRPALVFITNTPISVPGSHFRGCPLRYLLRGRWRYTIGSGPGIDIHHDTRVTRGSPRIELEHRGRAETAVVADCRREFH